MKILVLGDSHFKDNLSYDTYIKDGRKAEKKEILDFIVDKSKDCQHIVFMGDFFHAKNNSSETNKQAVEFLERFGKKEIYIIVGNHSKKGDGTTAIDFLREIKDKNWHIYTSIGQAKIGELNVNFLPYMLNSELGVDNHQEASNVIIENLEDADILFAHHSITGTSWNGIKADMLTTEIVLPREVLEKKHKIVIAGHIHEAQQVGNTWITGNIFTTEVGDISKFIYTIDDRLNIEKVKVPCRGIYKLENPTLEQIQKTPSDSIVKVILTKKITDKRLGDVEELKLLLETSFDASLLIEDYPDSRKKMHVEQGAMDFSLEALLKLYAIEKNVELSKLLRGLQIINNV